MGQHYCEWCFVWGVGEIILVGKVNRYEYTSSGDVTLTFGNGHTWVMPDMITHYVADHDYRPPEAFVHDVMMEVFTGGDRRQTRAVVNAQPVGYLTGSFETGSVPDGFVEKLEKLMTIADKNGYRLQTKSLGTNNLRG